MEISSGFSVRSKQVRLALNLNLQARYAASCLFLDFPGDVWVYIERIPLGFALSHWLIATVNRTA